MKVLVTGGAGYLGSVLTLALLEQGHRVRVLDNLMYTGRSLLATLGHPEFELCVGDLRDAQAVDRATAGIDTVVHLAAIVGDPACARNPDAARDINEQGSFGLMRAAAAAGVAHFLFASTCSNYGRMADTSVLASEEHALQPLSLYAESKVAVERELLGRTPGPMAATVLRFATLYGLSPRMRFDLTVNQFVMESLVHHKLVVFGEGFWRPYVHVRDAAQAIVTVINAPRSSVAGQVFNVGATPENYRKKDLIEIIGGRVPGAAVEFVAVADDPRDYKVSFERIRSVLGFVPRRQVRDGVDEIALAIESGIVNNPEAPEYGNTGQPDGVSGSRVADKASCAP